MNNTRENLLPTRYSLLSRLHNWDDQESWKDFFDTYWRLIYGLALKSGLTEEEAQDTVQETVISVAKHIEKFNRDPAKGSFKGWLRNIIRWRIADQLKKRLPSSRQPPQSTAKNPMAELDDIINPYCSALEAIWDLEWQQNLVDAALERVKRQIKEEHYQMFDLYVVKKWPISKVAKTLGVSAGRVYLAKHRVSGLLKKEIQRLDKSLS